MSYCRWSNENGYCDAYVYESENGWVTHIAALRPPPGAPPSPMEIFTRPWGVWSYQIYRMRQAARDAWSEKNPSVPIDHPEAGASFTHASPLECAENLARLKREGFMVPQYAIDALLEYVCQTCEGGGWVMESTPAGNPVEKECPDCMGDGYV